MNPARSRKYRKLMKSARTNKISERVGETSKRKAETSPEKKEPMKRAAFGDLTNALGKDEPDIQIIWMKKQDLKKICSVKPTTGNQVKLQPTVKTRLTIANLPVLSKAEKEIKAKINANVNTLIPESVTRSVDIRKQPSEEISQTKKAVIDSNESDSEETTIANVSSEDNSLYISAVEELDTNREVSTTSTERRSSVSSEEGSVYASAQEELAGTSLTKAEKTEFRSKVRRIPYGVCDFDNENINDPFQVATYAMDIFEYLKSRESNFVIDDYMQRQSHVNPWKRALVVDWMVDVQESLELNHETLYLGVKLVDQYLSKVTIGEGTLPLIAATAMLIASKYDERMPPLVHDFVYISEGKYTANDLLSMECNLLKVVGFDLGIPLSYRFLRRYARCAKLDLELLTLARFILETSLMDYDFVNLSDSKLASAALFLALKMKNISGWTPTLEYYTGYKLEDFKGIVYLLNSMLHQKPNEALSTIREKYSHKIFFRVTQTPLIQSLDL